MKSDMDYKKDQKHWAGRKNSQKKPRGIFLSCLLASLWMFSVGSAFGVVYTTYESRKSIQELENLRREEKGLQVISGQLLLEKSVWSSYSRIERIALEELNMVRPGKEKTVLIYK